MPRRWLRGPCAARLTSLLAPSAYRAASSPALSAFRPTSSPALSADRLTRPPVRSGVCLTTLLALALLPAACDERSRPSPVDPGIGLDVSVVEPSMGDSFRPGALAVSVHGHDTIGRLSTLGVILRTSPGGARVDSAAVSFGARTDTTVTLQVQLPRVTSPAAFDVVGFAVNLTGGDARSLPVGIAVLPCPASGC